MLTCPACGQELDADAPQCSRCHLPGSLFAAVRDAAGSSPDPDAAYLRTIGEILSTVESEPPAPVPDAPTRGLLGRSGRFPALPAAQLQPIGDFRSPTPIPELKDLPELPAGAPFAEVRRRLDEYFLLGRRLGLDFTDFEARYGAARLSDDLESLNVLLREMFVHIASVLAEEYESALGRRNELAQLVPTRSADVEFEAIRRAITTGDLAGAQRRLVHVRDELSRVEEQWEVGRILVTECDLLAETLRELGGDPTPAMGPLDEGRRYVQQGRRKEAEHLLARAAMALWAFLEPKFLDDLKRLRDRMIEVRASGGEVGPALRAFRDVASELKQRNYGGTILAYRQLRGYLDRTGAPEVLAPADEVPVPRTAPSA